MASFSVVVVRDDQVQLLSHAWVCIKTVCLVGTVYHLSLIYRLPFTATEQWCDQWQNIISCCSNFKEEMQTFSLFLFSAHFCSTHLRSLQVSKVGTASSLTEYEIYILQSRLFTFDPKDEYLCSYRSHFVSTCGNNVILVFTISIFFHYLLI